MLLVKNVLQNHKSVNTNDQLFIFLDEKIAQYCQDKVIEI